MIFTKKIWIEKGLQYLNDEGSHAMLIDYMCDKFKITKGSFYHYFDSIGEFILLVVQHWEKQSMDELVSIEKSKIIADEKLNRLRDLSFRYSAKVEMGLRGWAMHIRKVKNIVEKVEKKQLALLAQAFVDYGAKPSRAQELAVLIHAGWVGILICDAGSNAEAELRDRVMSRI